MHPIRARAMHSARRGCRVFAFPGIAVDMNRFQDLPDSLSSRIQTTIRQHPELAGLFQDIATHISTLTATVHTNGHAPTSKKRKLETETSIPDTFDSIADISFSIPQRKKLKLEISRNSESGAIRGTNAATGQAEFGIRYSDVDYCICLPVPEKAQPQYSFCVFPTSGDDQLLFSVPGTKIKTEAVESDQPIDEEQTYKDVVIRMMSKRLKKTKVIEPNEKDFVSTIAQAHRKGEKAVHVKAFRGSKDGFLFFLPTGIIFAFKKPLLFYPFHSIASISYTSVLQRTFNLNINVYNASNHTSSNPGTETHEIEFSMIDQVDFAGIDAYIKRRNLQDASMAEQRRAQKYNVNGTDIANGGEGASGGQEEEGELQKAQREAEDMEDEEEEEDENFDPGSEGESEGSGSGSEEEDEEGNVDADGNLIEMELGSEAEDVTE
ncbi:MAG: hypothetical protein Q9226_008027 [Calogaya cf. arnoldii]